MLLNPAFAPFIWTTLIFTLLLFIMVHYIWPDILSFIEAEEAAYQQAQADKQQADKQLAAVDIQSETIIAKAKAASRHIEHVAEATKASLLAEAKLSAEALKSKALKEGKEAIVLERKKMQEKMKEQVALLALQTVEKLLQQEMQQKEATKRYMKQMLPPKASKR